jgi:hypothetical protein
VKGTSNYDNNDLKNEIHTSFLFSLIETQVLVITRMTGDFFLLTRHVNPNQLLILPALFVRKNIYIYIYDISLLVSNV